MDVIEQLDVIVSDLHAIAGRVRPDQFDDPTPCAHFRVRDLFDHLIGGASQLAPQLRGEEPTSTVDPSKLDDSDRHAAVSAALDELLAAARAPGALGRTVTLPFGVVPGSVLVRFLTVDGMVHSWDLADATGQPYSPSDALVENVLESARQLIAPEMRDGDTFAPEVSVSDDAPALTRLVGFTGRRT